MLNTRFLWQVWGILGITLAISTAVFSFFVIDEVERDAFNRIETSLLEQATALSPEMAELLEVNQILSPEQIKRITPGVLPRLTLLAEDGTVLADNKRHPDQMDNHGSRPEVVAARSNGTGRSIRSSETLGLTMLYLAVPLYGEERQGVLRLAVPLTPIEQQLDNLQGRIVLSAGGIGLLFLLIGYLLASRVSGPIERMTEIAASIAKGEFQLRLPTGRRDEIGKLSTAINELALGAEHRIAELTRHRNQLEAVLAGLTEGVIAFDATQQVLHVNEAALNKLGLEKNQVDGSNLSEIGTVLEIRQAIQTCVSEQADVETVATIGDVTLECSCTWLDTGIGDAAGGLLVLEDVTEARLLEKVRSDFVANASHELKTPISAIRGLSETIIDDPGMASDVLKRFVERIRQQSIRLDLIVQDLLHLSRFDNSKEKEHISRIRLSDIVKQVYDTYSDHATDASLSFELDIQAENLDVDGDPEAIDQMLANLVDNAIKYSGKEGSVVIALSRVGEMACISVKDTGIGISRDETQRIFERFYRVDRARSQEIGGTGLGLAIVKHIAKAHSGSVTVESQLGQGATFIVRLPLAKDQ